MARPRVVCQYICNYNTRSAVVVGIEVKSGRPPDTLPGMSAFVEAFKPRRTMLVGADGVSLEEFLSRPVTDWLRS